MADWKTLLWWIGVLLIIILILNIVLIAMRIISSLTFWIVIAVIALIAYSGIPRLKR